MLQFSYELLYQFVGKKWDSVSSIQNMCVSIHYPLRKAAAVWNDNPCSGKRLTQLDAALCSLPHLEMFSVYYPPSNDDHDVIDPV